MKKLLYLLAFLPLATQAQSFLNGKNIIKTNLSSLALNNYNISYERLIYNKFSLMLSYRTMPKSNIPFEKIISNAINDPNVTVERFQIGGYAITPELRFYSHKNMKGFYIAPYARIASFDLTIPIKYDGKQGGVTVKKDADFSGTIKSFSGGILLGTQHQLFKKLVIDIWIIGGHYGSSNGDLLGSYAADPNAVIAAQERQSLQDAINKIDVSPFVVTGKVNTPPATAGGTQTATLTSTGPWAGLRGAGLTIGFRF